MEFQIERAEVSDYQVMAEVIRQVYEAMERKEWYVADNEEYTYRMLSEGTGIGYKAVEVSTGEIGGIFMATLPGDTASNLGNDIGFSKEQRLVTAHMDSVAILPKYRGNHLQYRLMQEAERELREMGYRYLMCTVHPENRFSKENVLRQGYRVMKTTEKYGGYLRDILLKEL